MFRSKSQTQLLLGQQEAVNWSALYMVYEEWAWQDEMLAKQYLTAAPAGETGQWNTGTNILDFVPEDAALDLIVGGTDGKVHLLHNIQAYADTGALQVTGMTGIIGRSLHLNTSKSQEHIGFSRRFYNTCH